MNEELPGAPAEQIQEDRLGRFLGGTALTCFGTGGLMQVVGIWVSSRPSMYASSEVQAAAQANGLEWSTRGGYVALAGIALLAIWGFTELVVDRIKTKSFPENSE